MCSVTVMKKQLFFLSPRHEKGAAKIKGRQKTNSILTRGIHYSEI
jgi:hypothetical protein